MKNLKISDVEHLNLLSYLKGFIEIIQELKLVFKAWRKWRLTSEGMPSLEVLNAIHSLEEKLVSFGILEKDEYQDANEVL